MITAAYTICKNEIRNLPRWLYYGSFYDYRVLLDTGSTDGTWELMQEYAAKDPNLICEQRIFTPWHFSEARNYNLGMVPQEVDWCLSPDLDEFFTKNTLDEILAATTAHPTLTNLACDRFDMYSYTPRVGPPNHIPSNKIHKRHGYIWVQPIYEHLRWVGETPENELYSDSIYIVHDQDFNSEARPELYIKMLTDEYDHDPTNTWCLWFLVYHYHKSLNMPMFVKTACDYIIYHETRTGKNYLDTVKELHNIYLYKPVEANEADLLTVKNTLTQLGII